MATSAKRKPAATLVKKGPPAAPAAGKDIDQDTRLRLYQLLLELRYCEKRAYDLFLQNLIKGTSHLALGQEAIAAAFGVAMRADDWTFCTYRGHAHTQARGGSMTGVLGELMGRVCGLLKGKGGSMHFFAPACQPSVHTGSPDFAGISGWKHRKRRSQSSFFADAST